jgi:DNA polymerase II small subunit|tara:strand:+ start:180 stop:1652 length:1473 start_codon:yes stop_codon:yes gene_type:complete
MGISSTVIIKNIIDNGFQLDPKALDLIKNFDNEDYINSIISKVISSKIKEKKERNITKKDLSVFLTQKKVKKNDNLLELKIDSRIEIVNNVGYNFESKEGIKGFQKLFESRYNKLLEITSLRPNFHNIRKISSIKNDTKDKVKRVSGLVMEKKIGRKNVLIKIDDGTGTMDLLAFEKNIIEELKKILLDSFIIIDFKFSNISTAIIKAVTLPDIPEHKPTLSNKLVYAVFTSDLHVGSKHFLNNEFISFINWLSNKEKDIDIIKRIKYLIIAGDSVDGIGVYPGQEYDLIDSNLKNQYKKLAKLLKMLPSSIEILIIPGNHDPVIQSLPQPPVSKKYANDLYCMKNVTMLGNPAYVRLHGVNVLIYHGRSLDDVIAKTPGLSYNRPSLAMKLLLRSRHLSPVYGERSSSSLPAESDELVISNIPDIFHSGHMHVLDSEKYRGTLILNSGTWQSQTPFQAKMGIDPVTGIIPVVNLSTLEVFTKDFKFKEE